MHRFNVNQMRYLTLLQPAPNPKIESNKKDSNYHITSMILYDKIRALTIEYDTKQDLRKLYKKIIKYIHPFDHIAAHIRTPLIPDCPPLKITNAFMKMYEFLMFIEKYIPTNGTWRMFDVAGAPGMFVIATIYYLKRNGHKLVELDWETCSLIDSQTALSDYYRLYEHNPARFIPCDVTKPDDIKKCIATGKYDLVTGDIGMYHDNDFSQLQEESHLDVQYGQAILALNLTQKNSIMFLKMYTYATEESRYLVDLLSGYFEQTYICKPFTSRVVNDESYIICINRNDRDCSSISLTRPCFTSYESPNSTLYNTFDTNRSDYKLQMVSLIYRILSKRPNTTFKFLLQNHSYKLYYEQFRRLFDLFYTIKDEHGSEKPDDVLV